MHLAELLILKSKPFWNNSIMIPKQVALFDKQHYLRFSEIFTSEAVPVTLSCEELCTDNDDTCDGHGSHRGSPRHGNGGRHYKSYGAVIPAAV